MADAEEGELAETFEDVEEGYAERTEDSTTSDEDAATLLSTSVVDDATIAAFIADIADVAFSSPEYIHISKIETDTTAGEIARANDLAVQYSIDLSEEDIEELEAKAFHPLDWALITLQAFFSEEKLTIILNTGEKFVIKVTDDQAGDPLGLHNEMFVITTFDTTIDKTRSLKAQIVENVNPKVLQAQSPPSSDTINQWIFVFDEDAFEGTGGYYLRSNLYNKYIRIDENNNFSFVDNTRIDEESEEEQLVATPFKIRFNNTDLFYQLSISQDFSDKFLTYNAASNTFEIGNTNNDNTRLLLRDPNSPSSIPGTVGTWDVKSDGIVIKLFDYNGKIAEQVNGTWRDKTNTEQNPRGAYIDEAWAPDSTDPLRNGSGINYDRSLLFSGSGMGSGKAEAFNVFTGTSSNDSYYSGSVIQNIVERTLLDDKYPVLTSSNRITKTDKNAGGSLAYLFDDSQSTFGTGTKDYTKKVYAGSDGKGLQGLLRKDSKGYYYYDSEDNFAKLVGDEIILYSDTYKKNSSTSKVKKQKIGFFPFDDYTSDKGEEKGPSGADYNHQFGMTISTEFVYPKNGIVPDTNEPMIFEFSGDDDVWVFIDGVLVLDLGGVHQPIKGVIDFSQQPDGTFGKVTIYEYGQDGVEYVSSKSTSIQAMFDAVPDKDFNKSEYSPHKLDFFYLERGGCDSNCSIRFNLLLQKELTVAKKLNGLTPKERLKYMEDVFLYELAFKHNSNDVNMTYDDEADYWKEENQTTWRKEFNTYSTNYTDRICPDNYTIRTLRDGTEVTGEPIVDGEVHLKAGESMTITHLPRTDIFYLAEEYQLDMEQFEQPHAERVFIKESDQQMHEEEVHLHEDHAKGGEHTADWETRPYALEDTEKIVYTNTLQEKNLEVKKHWNDEKTTHPAIQFKLHATVNGVDYTEETGNTDINAQWTQTTQNGTTTTTENILKKADGTDKLYTLSAENNWTINFEHLPKKTELLADAQKEILYTVEEIVPDGYTTTDPELVNLNRSYLDIFKFWPDDNSEHAGLQNEPITVYVKNKTTGKYVYAEQEKNWEWKFLDWSDSGTPITLQSVSALPSDLQTDADGRTMFDYAARINNVPIYKEDDASIEYEYVWEEPKDANPNTTGVVMFQRPVQKYEIENTPFEIKVKKNWVGEWTEEAKNAITVALKLGRYKLVDKTGDLQITLTRELDPANSELPTDYSQVYYIKNADGKVVKTVAYDSAVTYPITVSLPAGTYTISAGDGPDGYTTEHTISSTTVTVTINKPDPEHPDVEPNSEATAYPSEITINSKYTRNYGTLTIRSTVTGLGSNASYNPTYTVVNTTDNTTAKDSNGADAIVSFDQLDANHSKTFTLPEGNYKVVETGVSVSDDYNLKSETVPAANTVIQITKNGGETVSFAREYEEAAQPITVNVYMGLSWNGQWWMNTVPTLINKKDVINGKSSEIKITFDTNCKGIYGFSTVFQNLNSSFNGREIIINNYSDYVNNQILDIYIAYEWNMTVPNAVKIEGNVPMPSTSSPSPASAPRLLSSSIRRALSGETEPKNAKNTDPLPNPPEPPAANTRKFVPDTSFTRPVTLTKDGSWEKILDDLPAYDEDGNPYYYYISEVNEQNVPKDGKVTIDSTIIDQEKYILWAGVKTDNKELSITNTLEEKKGSLIVTKSVKDLDGNKAISGMYSYPVVISVQLGTPAVTYYVQDQNGMLATTEPATSLTVSNTQSLTIRNLPYGTYTVSEKTPSGVIVSGFTFVNASSTTSTTAIVGATDATAELTNSYIKDVTWTPSVAKLLNGSSYQGTDYRFILTETTSGRTYSDRATTSAADGKAQFQAITYHASDLTNGTGTFTYTIQEDQTSKLPNIAYDSKTIYVKVTVIQQNGKLTATGKYYSDAACTTEITGTPTFDNTETATLKVQKTVTGDYTATNQDAFPITIKNGSKYLNKSGQLVDTDPQITIKAGETLTFSNIPVGTYVVTEGNADKTGYLVTTTYKVGTDQQETGRVTLNKGDTKIVTIENHYTREVVEVTASKEWQDKSGNALTGAAIPVGATVTFILLKNGTEQTDHTVVLDGQQDMDGNTPKTTGDYEDGNWTAHFTGLPKYDEQNEVITYTVKESVTWTGYAPISNEGVASGGAITNKQQSVDLDILKIDSTDSTKKLPGAIFTAYQLDPTKVGAVHLKDQNEKDIAITSAETNAQGKTKLSGLTEGYYEITETKIPDGYLQTGDAFYIRVHNGQIVLLIKDDTAYVTTWSTKTTTATDSVHLTVTTTQDTNSTSYLATVMNTPGIVLPSTGGPGTVLFTILGAILSLGSGIFLLLRRRRRRRGGTLV